MTINFLGIDLDILSLITFIFTTLMVTELLKKLVYSLSSKYIKKEQTLKLIKKSQFLPLTLSWIVGAIIFTLLNVTVKQDIITYTTIIQFLLMTALMNGGYKILKPVIKLWVKEKGL